MIKAVIFDCFGVLVAEGWKPFATRHFGEASEGNERRKWANSRMHQVSKGLLSHEALADEMTEAAGISREEFLGELQSNPSDQALLEYIKNELKPHFKIGFLSNVGLNRMSELFTKNELELFDEVVLSFETGMAKPDKETYEHMANLLAVSPSDCIFVDDTSLYCTGAENVGMKPIFFTNTEQFKQDLAKLLQ